jgi:hypothetical protein
MIVQRGTLKEGECSIDLNSLQEGEAKANKKVK